MSPKAATVEATQGGVTQVTAGELAEVMSRTLPEAGMDRMTDRRIEEALAVPALTAHL